MKISKRQLRRIIREHTLNFGPDIGAYCYKNEGKNMKITKRQLRRIIREEKAKLVEQSTMGPAAKMFADSMEDKFMRVYPDTKVDIGAHVDIDMDGRWFGFITVNGVKAFDLSQATFHEMSDDEMVEKMHAVIR